MWGGAARRRVSDGCDCVAWQVADYFARLVQRVAPKHYAQAMAEVTVTRLFLENFSGDQVP